jgi:uncharacterized membrane protein YgdD (TMEM256/DUF423 family)
MNTFAPPVFVVYRRYLSAIGSLFAGLSVALAAYAVHAASAGEQGRLLQAALIAFTHGLALTVLAPMTQRPGGLLSLLMLLLGVFLFSGSLLAASMLGVSPMLAPYGGALLISGWLLHAYERLRG